MRLIPPTPIRERRASNSCDLVDAPFMQEAIDCKPDGSAQAFTSCPIAKFRMCSGYQEIVCDRPTSIAQAPVDILFNEAKLLPLARALRQPIQIDTLNEHGSRNRKDQRRAILVDKVVRMN